jgi:hypothetical protein
MVIPLSYFQGGVKTVTNILYFDGDGFGMLYKRLDNGPKMKMKYAIFHSRSFTGSLKGYRSS